MKKTLLGISIELAAFFILVLSEQWNIPLTFAILTHLWGVYFFTKGLDPRLSEIQFTRELCFLFAFFFPIAGMAGLLFYLFILKKVDHTVIKGFSHDESGLDDEKNKLAMDTVIEYIELPTIPAAPLRRIRMLPSGRGPDDGQDNDYVTADDYEAETAGYTERIAVLQKSLLEKPKDESVMIECADVLYEYASRLALDKYETGHYLDEARKLYEALVEIRGQECTLLEKIMNIHFLLGAYTSCMSFCEEIISLDSGNSMAHARLMECCFRRKNFKLLAQVAKRAKTGVKNSSAVRELAEMWCQYA